MVLKRATPYLPWYVSSSNILLKIGSCCSKSLQTWPPPFSPQYVPAIPFAEKHLQSISTHMLHSWSGVLSAHPSSSPQHGGWNLPQKVLF